VYLRQKKNKSGVISVQIIDKSTGKYTVLKTIGSSSIATEVARLVLEGKQWIKKRQGTLEIDFTNYREHMSASPKIGQKEVVKITNFNNFKDKLRDEKEIHRITNCISH
jgi:hypothetical protein